MKFSKFFLIILAIIFTLSVLVACSNGNNSDDTNFSEDETTEHDSVGTLEPIEVISIKTEDIVKYAVVRSEDASSEVISATSDMYHKMTDIYGKEISLKDDFVVPDNPKFAIGEYEILIGETNREESAAFLDSLRVNDYGYAVVGQKIVIAGGSDDATILAIEKFSKDIIEARKASAEVLIDTSDAYLFEAEYAIDTLTLNGIDINNYTIVYKYQGTYGERELAQSLRSTIIDATGYRLDMISDKDASNSENEILIGKTNRSIDDLYSKSVGDNGYYIGSNDKCVVLWGSSAFATMSAVNDFSKQISGVSGIDAVLSVQEKFGSIQENSQLRAMSFNAWVSGRSDARDERVVQMVLNYMPDVIGFQETGSSWMSVLTKNLDTYYAYVGEGRDGGSKGEYNPIFYRKDKFTLLDSGTKWLSATPDLVSKYDASSLNRIFTYAKLKRISDGAEFIHINTHLEHTSGEAREKQAKVLVDFISQCEDIPMIITGDFNCVSGSAEYKIIDASIVTSATNVAEKKENVATFHNY